MVTFETSVGARLRPYGAENGPKCASQPHRNGPKVHYALDCWFDVGSRKAEADPWASRGPLVEEGNGLWSTRLRWRARAPLRPLQGGGRWRSLSLVPRGVEGYLRRPRRRLGLELFARRRGGRHREAAKQVAGTRGADLLSFDRTSGARSLVRVMSGKGKGGVGHRISPPRPQVNPRGSRRSSSSARAGPRMGQSMQCGWPLRPILTWRWLVSARCKE